MREALLGVGDELQHRVGGHVLVLLVDIHRHGKEVHLPGGRGLGTGFEWARASSVGARLRVGALAAHQPPTHREHLPRYVDQVPQALP